MPIQPSPGTTRLSFSESKMESSKVSPHQNHFCIYNLRLFSEKTTALNETVDPELLGSMREGVPGALEGVPKRNVQENDSIPKIAPKWLKYDRQVSLNLQLPLVIT